MTKPAFLFLMLMLAVPTTAHGQQTEARPLVGLVLSGGSAKGIAHVGVLKVLEEEGIPIDVVTGTSAGAMVGGLYAIGYTVAQLEDIVANQDWTPLFTDPISRRDLRLEQRVAGDGVLLALPVQGLEVRLPGGVLAGQELIALLSRLTWGYQQFDDLAKLPVPFSALATHLRTGAPSTMPGVGLALAIRASMSLPSLFAPVQMGDEFFVDGGLSRNLPASNARLLGADIIIGVDVGALADSLSFHGASLIDVLVQASWYQAYESDAEQRELVDVLIRPDITGLGALTFGEAATWIARGEAAARRALPRIRAVLDSLQVPRGQRRPPSPNTDPVRISEIEIQGTDGPLAAIARLRLGLGVPAIVGPEAVDEAIARVYATGLFQLVTYRILPRSGGGHKLSIRAVPRDTPDRLGFGFRYDSHHNAQLLFTLTFRNRLRVGSTSEFRLRLGEQSELSGRFFSRLGTDSRVTTGARVGYAGAPVRLFLPAPYARAVGADPDVPVRGLRLDVGSVSGFVGYTLSESAVMSFRGMAEYVWVTTEFAGALSSDLDGLDPLVKTSGDYGVVSTSARLTTDSFNRRTYPSRGFNLSAEVGLGISSAETLLDSGSDPSSVITFGQASLEGYLPLEDDLSLFGRAAYSHGAGEALPISYYSFLGGIQPTSVLEGPFIPLRGLTTEGRFGRKAYMTLLGLQWEIRPDVLARGFVNFGGTFDVLVDDEDRQLPPGLLRFSGQGPALGFGMELGIRTPLGPASFVLSSDGSGKAPELWLGLGYNF